MHSCASLGTINRNILKSDQKQRTLRWLWSIVRKPACVRTPFLSRYVLVCAADTKNIILFLSLGLKYMVMSVFTTPSWPLENCAVQLYNLKRNYTTESLIFSLSPPENSWKKWMRAQKHRNTKKSVILLTSWCRRRKKKGEGKYSGVIWEGLKCNFRFPDTAGLLEWVEMCSYKSLTDPWCVRVPFHLTDARRDELRHPLAFRKNFNYDSEAIRLVAKHFNTGIF